MSVWANTTNYEHIVHKEVHAYFAQGKGKALVGLQRYEEALKAFDIAVSLLQPDVLPEFYSDKRLAYTRLAEQASFLETQAYFSLLESHPDLENYKHEEEKVLQS